MLVDWFGAGWTTLGLVALSTVGVYVAVLVYTRLAGLRSFAQMSGFDFAVNIAMGSLMATTAVSDSPSLAQGVVAMGTLFALQMLIATARRHERARYGVNNRSLLVMDGPEFIEEHLRHGQITKDDIRFKLREANVFSYEQVRAVVLETTGEITVLHAEDDTTVDADILADVRGVAHRLAEQTTPRDGGTGKG